MSDHGHSVPIQHVLVDNGDHQHRREEIFLNHQSDLFWARIMLPRNLQQRHNSMPGPKGTSDLEIGRLFLLFFGTASSMSSLSPAPVSKKGAFPKKWHHLGPNHH